MLITIPGVLSADQLAQARGVLARGEFRDGKLTAAPTARAVKRNEEFAPANQTMAGLNQAVIGTLCQHATFQSAVMPRRVSGAVFARYTPGMFYGDHVDDAVMGDGSYRTDIAFTVFLNEPADYDGGELVVRTAFGENRVKLPAGHAVVYPASSIHHVAEVSRGERLVAVGWAQSAVRDPARRELLFDLFSLRSELAGSNVDPRSLAKLDHSYTNLLRMWAEL